MKTILKIFKNDLIGIKKSILTIVLAIGLCILPALYAWFNIFANWDPYANTGNINIAVVNLDTGYTDENGSTSNMGQSVVEKLKRQTSIGWVFPDTEATAIDGVKSGEYYAAIVIGADFSYNMFNALTDNFVNPSFTYYENEKKNAVAPKITDTAVSTLKTSINETYIKAVSQKLISAIDDSDGELTADLSGSDFVGSLQNVDANLAGYQKTITSIIEANKKLKSDNKLKDVTDKSGKLISQANTAIDSSISDLDSTGNAYYQIKDTLQTSIDDISGDISDLENSAKLAQIKSDTADISGDLENIKSGADALKKKLDAVDSYIRSLDISKTDAMSSALERLDKLKAETDKIKTITQDTIDGFDTSALDIAQSALNDKLTEIAQSIGTVDDTFTNQIIPDMDNIMLNIKNSLLNAQNLLNTLKDTISATSTVFDNYKGTIDSMNTSLSDLSNLIGDIRGKIAEAIDQIDKASDSEVTDMIISFLNGDSESLATFLSKPVTVEEHYYYKIANYGSSMAPFYSVLAIWVGMTILVSLMKVHVKKDEYLKDARPHQLFWGRYLIFFLLSQIQVLVIVLGDLYILKIQCLHPFVFWAVGAMTGLTFSILIYSLTISFGDIGKALAVVIMVLQIAGSGGTYPIEALPGFFRQAYIFFPFPYAINAMRECIGGMYHEDLFIYLSELSIFIAVALVIGLIIRKPFIRIMHFIEKRMEDTDMM